MDICFKTDEGRFNYRVCALICNNNRILAMHDERSPYYYLPGGRVKLHETAEDAIVREINEELQIAVSIIRPVWFNQSFFIEDVNKEKYHEICMYYLVDFSKTTLLENGDTFTLYEGKKKLVYEWLPYEALKTQYIYPLFIKEKIFSIPDTVEFITEFK